MGTLEILSGNAWLKLYGQKLDHDVVIMRGIPGILPSRDGPVFEKAHTIHIENCDKNFVFYWCNERTFPNVANVHLDSHPCEPCVLYRWTGNDATTIWLSHRRAEYKRRWAKHREQVKIAEDKSATPTPSVL